MLSYETIEPRTLQLLRDLQKLPLLAGTRLVGGTALALQLGHRRSVDLDFFGTIPASSEEIRDALENEHAVTVEKESRNINIYLVDGIKADFVNYRYGWLDEAVLEDGLVLANVRDIAAMKVSAIIGRGTKKDFIDLYFLLQRFSLEEILESYIQKYPDGSAFIAMKSLSYFVDAEADPMPYMLIPSDWADIKAEIRAAVRILGAD